MQRGSITAGLLARHGSGELSVLDVCLTFKCLGCVCKRGLQNVCWRGEVNTHSTQPGPQLCFSSHIGCQRILVGYSFLKIIIFIVKYESVISYPPLSYPLGVQLGSAGAYCQRMWQKAENCYFLKASFLNAQMDSSVKMIIIIWCSSRRGWKVEIQDGFSAQCMSDDFASQRRNHSVHMEAPQSPHLAVSLLRGSSQATDLINYFYNFTHQIRHCDPLCCSCSSSTDECCVTVGWQAAWGAATAPLASR